jgi:hypothetical protein
MLLEMPKDSVDLFGQYFSNMERLDSILRDYKVVATGTAWKFGPRHDVKDLVFFLERKRLGEKGLDEIYKFLLDEHYMVWDLDDDDDDDNCYRSFKKERCSFEVKCITLSGKALAAVFDSYEAPYDFKMSRFWSGIYGVYTECPGSPDPRLFVYRSCGMDRSSMESLENEFSYQVAKSIRTALKEGGGQE